MNTERRPRSGQGMEHKSPENSASRIKPFVSAKGSYEFLRLWMRSDGVRVLFAASIFRPVRSVEKNRRPEREQIFFEM